MFLALSFISIPWAWYVWGPLYASVIATLIVLIQLRLFSKKTALFFVLGFLLILVRLEFEFNHILSRNEQHQTSLLTICVQQVPKQYGDEVVTGYARVLEQPSHLNLRRIKFSIYPPLISNTLHTAGVCYHGHFRLRQPFGRLLPGAFNADRYFFANDIDALAILTELVGVESKPDLTQRLYLQQEESGLDEAATAVWAALGLGWSTSMSSELKNLLSENQLMHLFVISGMHVGFIAGLLLSFFSLFNRCFSRFFIISRSAQALLSLLMLGVYVALLGFPIPATRALIMFALPIYGWISGVRFSKITILSITSIVLSLWQPEAWLQMGTWLSILSVVLLLFITQWPPVQALSTFGQVCLVQGVLSLSILPWAVAADLPVNMLSIVTNLLVTPIVALILLPLTLLLMVFHSPLLQAIYHLLVEWMVVLLSWTANFGLQLPFIELPVIYAVAFFLISLIWSLRAQMMPLAFFIIVIGIGLPIVTRFPALINQASEQVTVLDVGHGQAILFETRHGNLLYDTGGMYNPEQSLYDMSLRRAMPKLDAIVVSHSDKDHSAGIFSLHEDQPSTPVWAGEPEKLPRPLTGRNCHQQPITMPSFKFISVPSILRRSDNNHSCILLFTAANGEQMLITGDADRLVEYYLLQQQRDLFPVDVLLLGHHGSGSSSAADFLAANDGAIYLISSGDRAQPSWPAERIKRWFDEYNAQYLNTTPLGTLTVVFDSQGVAVRNESSSYRHRLIAKGIGEDRLIMDNL